MKLSIVIPVYNEGEGVTIAHHEIRRVLAKELPGVQVEIVFVDDGSRDDTPLRLRVLAESDRDVRVVRFVANRGSHVALRAALRCVTGDFAVYLPCDLQEPPRLIPSLLQAMVEPVQVVWAVRSARADPPLAKLFSRMFYAIAKRIVSPDFAPQGAGTFLLSRKVIDALNLYHERNVSLDGLLMSLGFPSAQVRYDREARRHGAIKWTVAKKLKLFADFFVGHSYVPIRLMSFLGISMAALGFLYALFLIVNRVFFFHPITGWTSLMVVVLVVGGSQMVMMGIIGEYAWRTLDEARARPEYIVDCSINIDGRRETPPAADIATR